MEMTILFTSTNDCMEHTQMKMHSDNDSENQVGVYSGKVA